MEGPVGILAKLPRTFRHGFATRMLRQDHSLKVIANVFAKRNVGTTCIYTKADFNAQKHVALK